MSQNSTNEGPQINADMAAEKGARVLRLANGRAFINRRVDTLLAEAATLAAQYNMLEEFFADRAFDAYREQKKRLIDERALVLLEEQGDDAALEFAQAVPE